MKESVIETDSRSNSISSRCTKVDKREGEKSEVKAEKGKIEDAQLSYHR